MKQSLLAGLPATDTLTTLNPIATKGVVAVPALTDGYTPSCAFAISVSSSTVDELYFLGMPVADQNAIASRVQNEGFAPGATGTIPDGSQQLFTKGTARIVLAHISVAGVSVFLVAG